MISYSRELPKPKSETEFEEMCAIVYGEVFGDPLPKLNGRRGQKQAGVDVYVRSRTGRIGIQSKRYKDGSLTLKHVAEEVRKAEEGPVAIVTLIVATTAANDAKLLADVMAFSDEREAAGKFPVQIEFWDDIRAHVARFATLQALYDPHAPGALFRKVMQGQEGMAQSIALISQDLQHRANSAFDTSLPGPLASSVNNAFTRQIDAIKDLLEAARYREANDRLEILAPSFPLLDAHQKARWHVQRGICRIHLFGSKGAAEDLITASELYPQDAKIVAAGIRGLVLQHSYEAAITTGNLAIREWPASVDVWTAVALARVENGEKISIDDVPPQMVSEPRVVSLLCWAALDAHDNVLAANYAQRLLALPAPSLAEKTTAFTAVLSWATEKPIARDFGFMDADARRALMSATAALEPRQENIWANQSLASVPADASNLCWAYYLLDRYEDVLAMCAEAPVQIGLSKRMVSLKLVSLKALGRLDELMETAPKYIEQIEPSAVAAVAEVAAWRGHVELVQQLAEHVRDDNEGYDSSTVAALAGMAMLNAGRRDDAIRVVADVSVRNGYKHAAAVVAARVLLAAGDKDLANARIDEVIATLPDDVNDDTRIMLADCLFFLKRHREAAKLYERYCIPGHFSMLHTRLLDCYVESGNRARARALLATFPPGWAEDDDAREAAISLAQRAADWPRLLELAKHQLAQRPSSIGSWLLRLIAERHGGSRQTFLNLFQELPEILGGSVRQQAQLAALQLQYGQSQAGVRRLYRMIRSNMHDANAASAYMTCMFMRVGASTLNVVSAAAPGTTVQMMDDAGVTVTVNIDPEDAGELPPHEDFQAPNATSSGYLYGAQAGDRIEIPGQFGGVRAYTVVSVMTVQLALLRKLQERLHSSPDGLPAVWSVNMQSQDGELDLTEMAAILSRSSESARNVFDTYAANPITIGVCAKVLGVTSLELAQGWPSDGPPIRVCEGDHNERESALRNIDNVDTAIVVDMCTLGEIVALDCEAALACYPRIYITSAAVHALHGLIESIQDDRSIGRAAHIDGQVRFVEYGDQYKQTRLGYLERVKAAIEQHCTVQPTYGTGDVPEELTELEELLGEDEYEALLLAKELGATLLTLDLVLRHFASTLGVHGVWPQPFLANAAMKGVLLVDKYRFATQALFRSNRTFIAVESEDILLMCRQGGPALRFGLEKVRTVFQSMQSDAFSCTHVVEGVIRGITSGPVTLGVIRELVEYLYEALFRHPEHLPDLEERALKLMRSISRAFASVPSWLPVPSVKETAERSREGICKYLEEGVRVAVRRASEAVTERQFPFEITKASVIPELRLARTVK
jgi:tetratricopeptide (TPR) repeat protein